MTTDHLASPAPGPIARLVPRTVAVLSPHDVVSVGLFTMLTEALPGPRVVDAAHHWVRETASIVVALTRLLRPDLGTLP